jgi:hypothetical protein
VDVSKYEPLLAEALRAYALDESYAVAVSRQAITVQNKRRVWQARLELRAAEASARQQCVTSDARVCAVGSPCGTGECPFAASEMASLLCEARSGKTTRPIPSAYDHYTIESAVRPFLARQAATA